jgi:hypothetical protein
VAASRAACTFAINAATASSNGCIVDRELEFELGE